MCSEAINPPYLFFYKRVLCNCITVSPVQSRMARFDMQASTVPYKSDIFQSLSVESYENYERIVCVVSYAAINIHNVINMLEREQLLQPNMTAHLINISLNKIPEQVHRAKPVDMEKK